MLEQTIKKQIISNEMKVESYSKPFVRISYKKIQLYFLASPKLSLKYI